LCRKTIESILSKLNTGFDKIIPSLVHGDLWSGNVASADGDPGIYKILISSEFFLLSSAASYNEEF